MCDMCGEMSGYGANRYENVYMRPGAVSLATIQQQSMAGLAYQGRFWSSLLGNAGGIGSERTQCNLLGSPYKFATSDSEGWYDYCVCPAPPDALCQFKQGIEEDEGHSWIGYSRDFHPEFNVAYLKWRYTGIAREERGL